LLNVLEDILLNKQNSLISALGIGLGATALLLAVIHFWAGPFSVEPAFQQTVSDKVIALKESVLATINGEQVLKPEASDNSDVDKTLEIITAILAGLAIILGVIGYASKEAIQVSTGAIFLGVGVITFKMLVLYLHTN
jgi:hypothetical protein